MRLLYREERRETGKGRVMSGFNDRVDGSRVTHHVSCLCDGGRPRSVQDGEPGLEVVFDASLHGARLQRGVKYHLT